MSKPFRITEAGGAGGPAAMPPVQPPAIPIQEVFDEARRTGTGLDRVVHEREQKANPGPLPWPAGKPLESGGKPFKL